jgi:hypothetical protein
VDWFNQYQINACYARVVDSNGRRRWLIQRLILTATGTEYGDCEQGYSEN